MRHQTAAAAASSDAIDAADERERRRKTPRRPRVDVSGASSVLAPLLDASSSPSFVGNGDHEARGGTTWQYDDVVEVALLRGVATPPGAETGTGTTRSLPPPGRGASPTHARFERLDSSDPGGGGLAWRLGTVRGRDDAEGIHKEEEEEEDVDDWCEMTWRADRSTPDGEGVAEAAFLALVRKGLLTVRVREMPKTFSSAADEGDDRRECVLVVGVTPEAMKDPPRHPEEVTRRVVHAHLRAALAWLAPPGPRRESASLAVGRRLTETADGESADVKTASDHAAGASSAHLPSASSAQTPVSPGPASHSLLQDVYRAARPPRDAPMLLGDFPELVPSPRKYQRQAVAWMVRRERGVPTGVTTGVSATCSPARGSGGASGARAEHEGGEGALHPLWSLLPTLGDDECCRRSRGGNGRRVYINWHTGQMTDERFPAPNDVRGGILADEMGLGKTVELLLCVLANRYHAAAGEKTHELSGEVKAAPAPPSVKVEAHAASTTADVADREREERAVGAVDVHVDAAGEKEEPDETEDEKEIHCVCGDAALDYEGLWLACEACARWSHARCVGYTRADEKRHQRTVARALDTSLKAAAALDEANTAPEYVCVACVAKRAGAVFDGPCGATLVVCPAPILPQWRAELARHITPGTLKVVVYDGQPRDAGDPRAGVNRRNRAKPAESHAGLVSAAELARADVVLTTYDVLRHDLHHCPRTDEAESGRRFGRHRRRYEVIPTPLTRLTWWRVVLDEAQEVESSTAKAAAMARLLPAVHRWAVSGTPVSRGLEDLQGLFEFLGGPSPMTDAFWWRKIVQGPYESGNPEARRTLHDLLQQIMWRNSRHDVRDELCLPPQGQIVTWLRPSGIEEHWYRQQKRVCERAARHALFQIKHPKRSHSRATKDTASLAVSDAPAVRAAPAVWRDAGPGRRLGGGVGGERGEEREENRIQDGIVVNVEDPAETATVDLTGAGSDEDDVKDRYLTPDESRRVLTPLLRLRQACNHPQAGTHGVRGLVRGSQSGGSGHIGSGGIHSGVIMTMPQIHAVLIERQRIEAEDAQRLVAFTLNASAGVAFCKGRFADAVQHYREVLRLETAGAKGGLGLRLDPLQRLHALHNLQLALDAAVASDPNGVSRTLRDASLAANAATERQKYLAQRAGGGATAAADLRKSTAVVKEALRLCGAAGYGPSGCGWWSEIIDSIMAGADRGRGMLDRMLSGPQLLGQWQGRDVAFTDLSGLRFQLESDFEKMGKAREKFLDRVVHLSRVTSAAAPEDVYAAGKCSNCVSLNVFDDVQLQRTSRNTQVGRNQTHAVLCQHCAATPIFTAYEDILFGINAKDTSLYGHGSINYKTDVGVGRSSPSTAEVVIRMLSTRLPKSTPDASAAAAAATAHLEAMEGMRREFTRAMVLQKHQRDELKAHDELEMATTRIRVRLPHEVALSGLPDPVPVHLRASVVHDWELDHMEDGYVADRATYESDLRSATSKLKFLERLRDEDDEVCGESEGAGVVFECPVCQEEVQSSVEAAELAVLPCGHRLCVSCTDALIKRAPFSVHAQPRSFRCPTCRARTPADEINYVSVHASKVRVERWPAPGSTAAAMAVSLGTEDEQLAGEAGVSVKGSWGTKIEAVVRRVLWLLDNNRPGAESGLKALVFSEWEDALRVVAAALSTNGVSVEHPQGGGQRLRDAIDRFKGCRESVAAGAVVPQVLLLPLRRGANGLNLTEATHVILLEPVLDPGAEAQAMKRVDRIGQTKPTFVHRFLLAGTVEENVQELSQRRRETAPNEAGDIGRSRGGVGTGLKMSEVEVLIPH